MVGFVSNVQLFIFQGVRIMRRKLHELSKLGLSEPRLYIVAVSQQAYLGYSDWWSLATAKNCLQLFDSNPREIQTRKNTFLMSEAADNSKAQKTAKASFLRIWVKRGQLVSWFTLLGFLLCSAETQMVSQIAFSAVHRVMITLRKQNCINNVKTQTESETLLREELFLFLRTVSLLLRLVLKMKEDNIHKCGYSSTTQCDARNSNVFLFGQFTSNFVWFSSRSYCCIMKVETFCEFLRALRPRSHRTCKHFCMQICRQILWCCWQCCVNTPIGNNVFHFLQGAFESTSASCVNGAWTTIDICRMVVKKHTEGRKD